MRGERACCDVVERDRRTRHLSNVKHRKRDVPANHANQRKCESLTSTLLAKTFWKVAREFFSRPFASFPGTFAVAVTVKKESGSPDHFSRLTSFRRQARLSH
jgi:hypothetical protein